MFSTYKPEDVEILLKDISGLVKPLDTAEREKLIQSGKHYSEMLPLEYESTKEYLQTYFDALNRFAKKTAAAVANVSKKIYRDKGENLVLVSLARAGTSTGVLIKHFIEKSFSCKVFHYTISIIRGIGIDNNAVNFILSRHEPNKIQFVDGWTGKGAIQNELKKALKNFPEVDSGLAVLSDPAFVAGKCGTHEDFLIASSCLNSTVSGLLSRTFLRDDIIGEKDFHGAAFYKNLLDEDMTYQFIDEVEKNFGLVQNFEFNEATQKNNCGLDEVKEIAKNFGVKNINFVKPGIGEATRVLLRRLPEKILVHSLTDFENLGHLYRLAKEKGATLEEYPLKNYKACGIIRVLADN